MARVLPFFVSVLVAFLSLFTSDCLSKVQDARRAVLAPKTGHDGLSKNLKLAAFNVQTFGLKKMATKGVPEILVKIILRYDVILIQEIRDSSGKSILKLLSMVNRESSAGQYKISISPRLGRSISKEQYAFLYRKDLLFVKAQYVYNDRNPTTGEDTFEREPYIVHFTSQFTGITDFVLVAIHTSPSKAPQEIDELTVVYDDVVKRLNTKDVVILGDLNAACGYMRDSDWRRVRLANDKRFHWLISDCVDTTVGGEHCAYDRFVVAGAAMLKAVVVESAGRFAFDIEYSINKTMASVISDHFPIEIQLISQAVASAKKRTIQTVEYSFKPQHPVDIGKDSVFKLRKKKLLQRAGFSAVVRYTSTRRIARITFEKEFRNTSQVLDCISIIQRESASYQIISDYQVEMAVLHITGAWGEKTQARVQSTGVLKLVCEIASVTYCWIGLLFN